jgi:predicted transposase/invertase (TIGR01784 family)
MDKQKIASLTKFCVLGYNKSIQKKGRLSVGKLLPPKSDIVFKLIFGNLKNIDLLSDFLRAALRLPDDEFTEMTIIDPHLLREYPGGKLGIVDVKAKTKTGKIVHIDVQLATHPQLRERIIYYDSRLIADQLGDGDDYNLIQRVISIIITDFVLIPENDAYHNRYILHDPETGSTLTDLIEVNTLELVKLPQETDDTPLFNWMRFLRAERKEEFDVVARTSPQIAKAVGILMELSEDERTRMLYEAREKERRDIVAYKKGAREEGREEGRRDMAYQKALSALKDGLPIEVMAKITGLTLEEVNTLRESK